MFHSITHNTSGIFFQTKVNRTGHSIHVITTTEDGLLGFVTRGYCVLSWDIDEQTGQKFDSYVELWDRVWKGVSLEQMSRRSMELNEMIVKTREEFYAKKLQKQSQYKQLDNNELFEIR